MRFYLGTHHPDWLEKTSVPLFLSRRQLLRRRSLPRARGRWVLDSGGFSELSIHGEWQTAPSTYVAEARRYSDGIGSMDWAAIQDHMCEPHILAKTGSTVLEHQQRTIVSYETLMALDSSLPWTPIIQGWEPWQYLQHVEMYDAAGVRLAELPVVGVGSVCRRQGTKEAEQIFTALHSLGIRCHGFGVKVAGLGRFASKLESADSTAWSSAARFLGSPVCGSIAHSTCANCIDFAMTWRSEVIDSIVQSFPTAEYISTEEYTA